MSIYCFSRADCQAARAVCARKRRTFGRRCVHMTTIGAQRSSLRWQFGGRRGEAAGRPLANNYRGSKPMADRALSNVLAAVSPARLAPSAKIDWTDPGS
jgi:hypothetical protein